MTKLHLMKENYKEFLIPSVFLMGMIFIVVLLFYSIAFLVKNMDVAFSTNVQASAGTRFDIEGFEKLNLTR